MKICSQPRSHLVHFPLERHANPRMALQWRPSRTPVARGFVVTAAAAAAPALFTPLPTAKVPAKLETAQRTILECLDGVKGRGKGGISPDALPKFDAAVVELERDGGAPAPACSPLLEGRWRLLYTSRPGTASPIQNSFTGVEAVSVFQELLFSPNVKTPRVNNIVELPSIGSLKVEAEASTLARPLPGFTPREGKGLPFGILGVSSNTPPSSPDVRIDFQFDCAAFYFKSLPFTIPYPVPFRLLRDERKGWIDVTYLSKDGKFRLSRGNKGTLFILVKDDPPRQKLLQNIASGASDAEIEALVEAAVAEGGSEGVKSPAKSPVAAGGWRLIWTKQGDTANPLQKQLAKSVRNWQIISEDGSRLENRVDVLPGVLRVRALAAAEPDSATRTGVVIDQVVVELGPLALPLPVSTDARGFVDWLYLDESMRITRGSKGSLFVHLRDPSVEE